jgi:vancomycin resistance protein YoaR
MSPQSQERPRRRRKKESLPVLLAALVVSALAWPVEKLLGSGRRRMITVVVLAIIVVAGVLFATVDLAAGRGKIHDNVTIYGIDVGGLTVKEAAQKLRQAVPKGGSVTLTWNGRSWMLSAAELHARLDAKAAAHAAYTYTREGGVIADGWRRLSLWVAGHDVEPAILFRQPLVKERLDAVARVVEVRPVQGGVRIKADQPVVRKAKDGRAIDRAAVLRLLSRAVVTGDHLHASLPVKIVVPVVSTADAESAAATARSWLVGPLTLTYGSDAWTIAAGDLGQYVAFVPRDSAPRLRVTFDSPVTRGWFDYITAQAGKPGKDSKFAINGTHVKVKPGTWGFGVVPGRTIANMEAAVTSGKARTAAAIFGKAPPTLTYADAKAMRITRRIATYTTGVSGDPNRLSNVGLGAQLLNNSLIAPGKVFSVNATTGERTAAKGFKMAPTIINGKLEDSVGGGMCQVSTTVFNAAFVAGLQIVERHNHMLYISHYPLGRDATVSYGSYDLKFRNDTPNWILLKTSFTGWSLTVSLYSAPLHRKVDTWTSSWYGQVPFAIQKKDDPTLAKGKTRIDTPGVSGMSIDCFRKVYDASGKLIWNDDFKSVYSMVPEVLLVGTKASPTPSPSPSGSGSSTPSAKPSPKPSSSTKP